MLFFVGSTTKTLISETQNILVPTLSTPAVESVITVNLSLSNKRLYIKTALPNWL